MATDDFGVDRLILQWREEASRALALYHQPEIHPDDKRALFDEYKDLTDTAELLEELLEWRRQDDIDAELR